MLTSYAIGLVAIVLVSVAWVAVQGAWGRAFAEYATDPDVLAGRLGCGGHSHETSDGSGCTQVCDRRLADGACPGTEEIS